MTFDRLGLAPELLHAVAAEGYTDPTPVQAAAIPHVLAGRDVLARAQTGTGKTAAFVLPILHALHADRRATSAREADHGRPRPRVLVLVPTRELALQVETSFRTYGARRPVRSVPIYGGVGYGAQFRSLRRGADVIVATPGRLLDHLDQRTVDLSGIAVLVLDEADRMLDMGFARDLRRVVDQLPAARQTLLFSATFSDSVRTLATGMLRTPATVDIAPTTTTADGVREVVIRVDRERKRDLLRELVASGRVAQALVFTRTKHGADRLARQLGQDGIRTAAIHGNRSQAQRIRALDDFKAGRVQLLVATEVAARGLDIDTLPHVVNFELPVVPSDYVHRIGRTGRAGATGEALSLVCVDEAGLLRDIERLIGRAIPTEVVAGFEPDVRIRPEPIRLGTTVIRTTRPRPMPAMAGPGGMTGGGGRQKVAPKAASAPRRERPRPAAEGARVGIGLGHGVGHGPAHGTGLGHGVGRREAPRTGEWRASGPAARGGRRGGRRS